MKEPKENKKQEPAENKEIVAPVEPAMVKIRFKQGRGASGVNQDANRFAVVDRKTADYLISLGYADAVDQPSQPSE